MPRVAVIVPSSREDIPQARKIACSQIAGQDSLVQVIGLSEAMGADDTDYATAHPNSLSIPGSHIRLQKPLNLWRFPINKSAETHSGIAKNKCHQNFVILRDVEEGADALIMTGSQIQIAYVAGSQPQGFCHEHRMK